MIARANVPRVKICGMTLLEDVIAAATAGADGVGFLVGLDYASDDALEPPAAANLVRRTPADILSVMVTHASTPDRVRALVPFLAGQTALDGRPTAYVCQDYACREPTTALWRRTAPCPSSASR